MPALRTALFTRTSPTVIAPAVTGIRPDTSIISVLLPQPLGPTMATNSPAATSRSICVERVDGLAARGHVALGDAAQTDLDAGARKPPSRYSVISVRSRFHGSASRSAQATMLNSSTPSSDSTTTAANSSGVSSRTCEINCR